jgi:hypothetical protein
MVCERARWNLFRRCSSSRTILSSGRISWRDQQHSISDFIHINIFFIECCLSWQKGNNMLMISKNPVTLTLEHPWFGCVSRFSSWKIQRIDTPFLIRNQNHEKIVLPICSRKILFRDCIIPDYLRFLHNFVYLLIVERMVLWDFMFKNEIRPHSNTMTSLSCGRPSKDNLNQACFFLPSNHGRFLLIQSALLDNLN